MSRRFSPFLKMVLVTLLLSGFVIGSAEAGELHNVMARGKLIVGVKDDYVPFGYLDSAGKNVGFEVDIAHFVAKALFGAPGHLELVPVEASNRIQLLNAGRIDVIFATLGVTADRGKVIDFTIPYYDMAGIVLLAPKNATYKSWADVRGKTLCGSEGNLYNPILIQKYGAKLVLFPNSAEIFDAFQGGRCDAIGFDGPILNMQVQKPGWKDKYKIALPTFSYVLIAGGVRKGGPKFLAAINHAILQAEAAGVMTSALVKYHMGPDAYVTKMAGEAKKKLAH